MRVPEGRAVDVLITCPVTGEPTPTGVESTRARFLPAAVVGAFCHCRRCRQPHEWDGTDAYFAGERPKPPPPQ